MELEGSDAAFLCSFQALRACYPRPFSCFPLSRRLVHVRMAGRLVHGHHVPYGNYSLESDNCMMCSYQDCRRRKCWGTGALDTRNSSSRSRTYLYWLLTIRFTFALSAALLLNKPPSVGICHRGERYTSPFGVAVFEVCNPYPKLSIKKRLFPVGRSQRVMFSALTFNR